MNNKLIEFLEKTSYFSSNQFGFRKGLSTENALYEFMEKVSMGINKGKRVSSLFLDITKAFDTVNHKILLTKLYNSGIRGVVYKWFESYLNGRKQCVRVNGYLSEFGVIEHGVPQGSVLGSTLFLTYINDLCNARLNGHITSFADDTALCYIDDNMIEIENKINYDLNALRWWFVENNMVLSSSKTNYINFGLRKRSNYDKRIIYKCLNCVCNDTECQNKFEEI